MLTHSAWVGDGCAMDHSRGTRVEPRQQAPLLEPQAVLEADLALSVTSGSQGKKSLMIFGDHNLIDRGGMRAEVSNGAELGDQDSIPMRNIAAHATTTFLSCFCC